MLCEQRAQISTLHTTASLVLSEVQAILEGGDGALLGQFLRCQEILDALNSIVVPEVPSVPPEMLVAFPESLITQLRQHGVVESSCEDELERVTARAEVAEEALRKTQKALELALAREAAAVRMPRSMWGSGDTLVRGSRPLAQTSRLQMFGY